MAESKHVCTEHQIFIAGVDVSDHVYELETRHKVGEIYTVKVAFYGVRIEEKDGHQVFHLVEREGE